MHTADRIKCCPDGLITKRKNRIKILDCTIRDGGICNDWHFSDQEVADTYNGLNDAGIDYMEIGYRTASGAFNRENVGSWRFCTEEDLANVMRLASRQTNITPLLQGTGEHRIKLSTMVDIGRITTSVIPPKGDTVIDVIRIATYAHQLDEAQRILDHCLNMGYETFMNVMAVSTLTPDKVDVFLKRLATSGTHNVAIVDSFGALFPHHMRYLVRKYRSILGEDIGLGVHCHNNQQQAFANSIAAIDAGVDFVDATITGMGRGAGNCPLELLLFYLESPKFEVEPILSLAEQFADRRDELRWGYQLPYAVTGYYNLHPKVGIERVASERPNLAIDLFERFAQRDSIVSAKAPHPRDPKQQKHSDDSDDKGLSMKSRAQNNSKAG